MKILFVYHAGEGEARNVTCKHYEMLLQYGNSVVPLSDSVDYLPNTWCGMKHKEIVPRGHHWSMSDGLVYNWALQNFLTDNAYIIMEWDTHCAANVQEVFRELFDVPLAAARVESNHDWYWVRNRKIDRLRGLVPFTCILINRAVLLQVSHIVATNPYWHTFQNNEARLGTVTNQLGIPVSVYPERISRRIRHEIVRVEEASGIYHAVKTMKSFPQPQRQRTVADATQLDDKCPPANHESIFVDECRVSLPASRDIESPPRRHRFRRRIREMGADSCARPSIDNQGTVNVSRCDIPNIGIELYQWSPPAGTNFGDELSRIVVERMTGRTIQVIDDPSRHPKLLAIGSVAHAALPGDIVWGTGHLHPSYKQFENGMRDLDVRAVRGPLTKRLLEQCGNTVPDCYGDPALLLPRLFPALRHNPVGSLGIVIHHTDRSETASFEKYHGRIIDVTMPPMCVVEAILSCERIMALSLHGMIVADAFGIPCYLMRGQEYHRHSYKYKDYLLSTGRPEHLSECWLPEPELPDLGQLMKAFPWERVL